ncbi:MAG: TolC family protein [Planctomycetales bacterium]|nr:TolC family protein [Planctomycetales bacterium]
MTQKRPLPKLAKHCLSLAAVLLVFGGCCFKRECATNVCQIPSIAQTCGPSQLHFASATICNDCGTGIPEAFSPYDLNEAALASGNLVPLTLEECLRQALTTSRIMRDLGGTIVRTPEGVNSTLDPAIVFSDPRLGEEAALSAFDANFFANSYIEENNRRFNNNFYGVNGYYNQYLGTSQVGVNKRSATGGLFSFRNVTISDNNNQSGNQLGRQSWESFFEAELRQPIMQGAGTQFNRIAGPGATPGVSNGVLVARTRTDISLIDFQRSVRDLVSDVENAYWDLYYAYRDLEAKIQVRDIAEQTLAFEQNRREGGAADIAQAEEQLHRFQADVIDALNGRPIDGTRTNNGSAGGTFRGSGGVRVAERKLRYMIGMPINDGMLIQPVDTPPSAAVTYDWSSAVADALQKREELKMQRWVVKQKELELIASKNFLMPQLDLIARYRLRGFGGDGNYPPGTKPSYPFFDSDLQEWQLGVEYNLPVGLRRAHAANTSARMALARETEILREQERLVHFGLSNSIGEAKRAYESMQLHEKRLMAIVTQLNALKNKEDAKERRELDVILETHRRLLDARIRFHQSQVEYALSLRNVHFEKGTLLDYNNVHLAESLPTQDALRDANQRIQVQDPTKVLPVRDPTVAQR